MNNRVICVDPSLLNCPVFYVTGLPGWRVNAAMEKNLSFSIVKKISGTREDDISNFFVEYNREFRYNQAEEQIKIQLQQMQQQMGGMFGYNPFGAQSNMFGMSGNIPQGIPMQNLPGMSVTHQSEQNAYSFQSIHSATPPLAAADYLRNVFMNQKLTLTNPRDEKLTLLSELYQTKKEDIDMLNTALQENLRQINVAPFSVQMTFDAAEYSVCYELLGQEMIYFSEVLLIYTSYSLPLVNSTEIFWRQPALIIYTVPVAQLESVRNQVSDICKTIEDEPQYQKLQENERRNQQKLQESQQRHNKELLEMQQRTNEQINASMQQTINRQRESNSRIFNAWTNVFTR